MRQDVALEAPQNARHEKRYHSDVFDFIEMFYNPKRRRAHTNQPSPVEFEQQCFLNNRTIRKTGPIQPYPPTTREVKCYEV